MTKHLLSMLLASGLSASNAAYASYAQYYVEEAVEYMQRGGVHTDRFAASKGKDMREFAYRCAYGLKAVQALDNAIRVADLNDKANLIVKRFDVVSSVYHTCGSYWPTKYGGKCDYDYKNKECDALKWGMP